VAKPYYGIAALRPADRFKHLAITRPRTESGCSVYWLLGDQLANATKQPRRSAVLARGSNGPNRRAAGEFSAGSLETELAAIGRAVPIQEWAKIPADYFANLDHYLNDAPKKK
jgi:hypothetical protein